MLADFRVLDLTWVLGGPFAGQLLAQLGAEVIKVEPLEGDLSRQVSSHATEFDGASGFFLSVNRGKSSIAMDLKKPEGRAVIYDLARKADAIVYGFAPSVPARLGLDPASLHAVNPRLTVAQLIGLHDEPPYVGSAGVRSGRSGDGRRDEHDRRARRCAGARRLSGRGSRRRPLSGARVRRRHAQVAEERASGERVQISLLDCQLALLTWQAQNYFISGEAAVANGARHPVIAPSDIYPCADGKFMAISPTGQQFWEAVLRGDRPARHGQGCALQPSQEVASGQRRRADRDPDEDVPLQDLAWNGARHLFAERIPALTGQQRR